MMEIEIEPTFKSEEINETALSLSEILRVPCDGLAYNQFFNEYMLKNLPVVITGLKTKTEISENWFGGEKKLNMDKLKEILKDHEVPVADCSKQYFDSHEKIKLKFSDYQKLWESEAGRDFNLYLKDFHLKQEFPALDFYNVPQYFCSDWLNEFLIDNNKDDYRFIYIGPKNTW